jgi:hypothetical protein
MNRSLRSRIALAIFAAATAACEKPPEIAPAAGAAGNQVRPSAMIAEFSDLHVPPEMKAGKTYRASLAVKNAGGGPWPALGPARTPLRAVRLAYYWYRSDGTLYKYGERTNLPRDIAAGETIRLDDVTVLAPSDPGGYVIEFDMLQEMVRWFGTTSSRIRVKVR